MEFPDCIEFANNNPVCALATAEGDQPRVRMLGFWFADETGFYFQTSTLKEFPNQLKANPKAEICFYDHAGMIGTMMRVTGEVEFLTDPGLRARVLTDRPFLKTFGLTISSPKLCLFRIPHGRVHYWTMDKNLDPKEYIDF
jgi:pyridoxamine 5'-phosphate oxidase